MKNGTMSGVSCIGSDEIDKSFRESAEFKEQDKQALLRCTPDKRSSLITPLLPIDSEKESEQRTLEVGLRLMQFTIGTTPNLQVRPHVLP